VRVVFFPQAAFFRFFILEFLVFSKQ